MPPMFAPAPRVGVRMYVSRMQLNRRSFRAPSPSPSRSPSRPARRRAGAEPGTKEPKRHRVDLTGETKTVGGSHPRGPRDGPGNGHRQAVRRRQDQAGRAAGPRLHGPVTGTFRIRNDRGTAIGHAGGDRSPVSTARIDYDGTADFTGGKGRYKGIMGTDLAVRTPTRSTMTAGSVQGLRHLVGSCDSPDPRAPRADPSLATSAGPCGRREAEARRPQGRKIGARDPRGQGRRLGKLRRSQDQLRQLDLRDSTATGTFRIRDDRGTAFGTVDMTFVRSCRRTRSRSTAPPTSPAARAATRGSRGPN